VAFRRAGPGDAESFTRLMADEDVFAGLLQLPYPSPEQWRKKLEARATEEESLNLVAVARDEVVGSVGLVPLAWTPRRRHVAGLGLSVAKGWQRRGIGTELMRRALDYADNWVGYLRLELTVYTDNAVAIALYEKLGFVKEGLHRAFALRDGVLIDSYAMARLHPKPPQLPRIR
jgi:putative acetyltransferase